MKMLIGAILIITVMAKPIKNVRETYRSYIDPTVYVADENNKKTTTIEIDEKLNNIDNNRRKIFNLSKEKIKMAGKLETILDLKKEFKVVLTDKEIDSFINFTNDYSLAEEKVNKILYDIEENYIENVKKELFTEETNLNVVGNNLEKVINLQKEAIETLEGFILVNNKNLLLV